VDAVLLDSVIAHEWPELERRAAAHLAGHTDRGLIATCKIRGVARHGYRHATRALAQTVTCD